MKTIKTIMAGLLCLPSLAAVAGTPEPWPVYSTGGTDVGNTLCYGVISSHSANNGAPVVTYLNATSDLSSSVVTFYTAGTPIIVTGANTTTSIPAKTNSISGYTANAIIVIQHMATDTYERRILGTCTSTAVVTTVAPTAATASGDRIWLCTAAGTIPVGAATKELNGPGIYSGQAQKPLLVEIDGTSACQLNAVCATYVK